MHIYRWAKRRRPLRERFERFFEVAIKAALLLFYPFLPALAVTFVWWYWMYPNNIHFPKELEGIATASWITTFGILYALVANKALDTVWAEYKGLRESVKNYDIDTFMRLCDEDLSPLVHVLLFVLSWSVLGAFMGLQYPDAMSGVITIGSTSYLFGLIFFIIREIDNPLVGVWHIRNLHEEWLIIDVKEWRATRYEQARNAAFDKIGEVNGKNPHPHRHRRQPHHQVA